MTHEHDFIKDTDGQVTCSQCGAMDDEMPKFINNPESWEDRLLKSKEDRLLINDFE